jgi:hypothetical protein
MTWRKAFCPVCENHRGLQKCLFVGPFLGWKSIFGPFLVIFGRFWKSPDCRFTVLFNFSVLSTLYHVFLSADGQSTVRAIYMRQEHHPLTGFLVPFWSPILVLFLVLFGSRISQFYWVFCVPRVVFGPVLD